MCREEQEIACERPSRVPFAASRTPSATRSPTTECAPPATSPACTTGWRTGLAQITDPDPPALAPLRSADRAYQATLDDLTTQADLAA